MTKQDTQPLVSVMLCTYNDEKTIDEAVNSVLSQTFSDFELIIWNDGSNDGTESILQTFSDPRIRYFYHENTGVGTARALAAEKARGKYIAVIDGDDLWMPSHMEEGVAFLEKHPEYVLVCAQCVVINEEGKELGRRFSITIDRLIRKQFPNNILIHSSALIRKDAYEACGGYAGLFLGEDTVLFMRLAKHGKMHVINKELIKYRIRDTSLNHIYNPYVDVLEKFRIKMTDDAVISDDDVTVYNEIYKLCRKTIQIQPPSSKRKELFPHQPVVAETVYKCLKPVLGAQASRDLIVTLKNLIFSIKYLF